MIGAIGGVEQTDRYGRVGVPGEAVLALPAGEVSVFYEEAADEVTVPALSYSVRPAKGGPMLASKGAGPVREEAGEGAVTRVSFDRLEVPAAGRYRARARAADRAGPRPALTFGEPLTAGLLDDLKLALWGLFGLLLAGAIALVTFVVRAVRGSDERVRLPPFD